MKLTHIATLVAALAAGLAQASPTAEQVKQLGTTLTPWGAEIAGNKDGSIPAYTGGISKAPAGFNAEVGKWIDPYATDKPVVSIDAKNMAQYADKLPPGVQEMLKRWPNYRVDVYPTRRSYPAMSKSRVDNTLKNASNPECKTTGAGLGIVGCWAGTPFPIPTTGYEVMWNHQTRQKPLLARNRGTSFVVDAAGNRAAQADYNGINDAPYWDQSETPYEDIGGFYARSFVTNTSPARDSGNKVLLWYTLNYDKQNARTWSYATGQRRTRLAPEFAYDTPITTLGGVLFYDEATMFAGRMDRFDYKLVGKKEMYVPYNTIKAVWSSADEVLGKNFVNPDVMRWELHRVWVVEATLKAGMRHAVSKRHYYVDEDSWLILATEGYDQAGKIFRVMLGHSAPNYMTGEGIVDFISALQAYDLARGNYTVVSHHGIPGGYFKAERVRPAATKAMMGPEAMASAGVR